VKIVEIKKRCEGVAYFRLRTQYCRQNRYVPQAEKAAREIAMIQNKYIIAVLEAANDL
jgi:hypothetical protein